ncbi:MAG: hypothetical protein AAB131_02785 [Actinomycetota bacterium]
MLLERSLLRWSCLSVVVAVSLVLTACGTSSKSVSRTTAAVEAAEPSVTDSAAEPGNRDRTAIESAASKLAGPVAYRLRTANGQVLQVSALGIDVKQEIDPDRPTTIVEVAANGDIHTVIDIGPLLGPLVSANPGAAAAVDAARVELWQDSTRIIIDARGIQVLVDFNPSSDLGPFAPGLAVIDLTALGESGHEDLVAALVGSTVVDPIVLGARLPSAFDKIERDPDDPSKYLASASYADVLEAVGGADFERLVRAAGLGIARALRLDLDDLTAYYVRQFESIRTDVVITIGDDGALSSLEFSADLSSVFVQLFAEDSGIEFDGATEADLAEASAAVADARWLVTGSTTFELDESIAFVPPEGDFEDRTEAAGRFLAGLVSD